jgi:type III secretory pathway component EscU
LDFDVFEWSIHVLSEIAIAHMLHGDADRGFGFIPAKRLDKAADVLFTSQL